MRAFRAIVEVTLRALVGRRRTILIALLACLPIVLGILVRIGGGRPDAAEILDALVIRTVCPLVALIVGTGAIGSEIEDGTLVFQLVKPVPRWLTALGASWLPPSHPCSSCRRSSSRASCSGASGPTRSRPASDSLWPAWSAGRRMPSVSPRSASSPAGR